MSTTTIDQNTWQEWVKWVGARVLIPGTGAPSAGLGLVGQYYINTSTGELYGPKTDSGWGAGQAIFPTPEIAFADLTDGFDLAGKGGKLVAVKGDASGLEPVDAPSGGESFNDAGTLASGYVRFAAAVDALDTITLIPDVEVWTAIASGPAGAREYVKTGVPQQDAAAFIDAVNADATSAFFATRAPGTKTAELIAKSATTVLTMSESTSGARTVVGQSLSGNEPATKTMAEGRYTVNAADVTTLAAFEEIIIGSVPRGETTPRIKSLFVKSGNTVKNLSFNSYVLDDSAHTSGWVLTIDDSSGAFHDGDIIEWTVVW